jgi:predicted DsbA family dithiol-disulfide isomerase
MLAGAILMACSGSESASGDTRATSAPAAIEEEEVLATIGDESITMADVREETGQQLSKIEHQYLRQRHQLVEETLQQMLRDRLFKDEADKRGLTVFDFLRAEVDAKITVTEQDVADWYNENRSELGGRSLADVSTQIEEHLREQQKEELTDDLAKRLWSERNVVYHFEPYRVELDNQGSPAIGPADAPVTLVEFSDFECPFCARFFPTLKQLEENYGENLRIVYRQFPLPQIHPKAFKAAEASLCAEDQGQFWAMHDLMFEEQDQLSVKDLKEKARRLGLDGEEFDACLDSGRHVERIEADVEAGTSVGVTGTPALFVNGIFVPGGSVPYETVARYIDEELGRAGVELETSPETAGS